MRFLYCFVFVYIHILTTGNSADANPSLNTGPGEDRSGGLLEHLRTINIMDFNSTHKYSNSNPREIFIKLEMTFIINIGIRIESLLSMYKSIIKENIKNGYDQIERELDELMNKLGMEMKEYIDGLNKELKEIIKEYDDVNYNPKIKDHKSFSNEEMVKTALEVVERSYKMVKEHINNSEVEEGLKSKVQWTVENKTVLMGLSIKIMSLKMINDYTDLKKINRLFIWEGIYYILMFERGIIKRIMDGKLEEKKEYVNKFLENYESAVEELIQRLIIQVKEKELILNLEERTYRDLEMVHKKIEEMIKPIMTLSGGVIKKVEL